MQDTRFEFENIYEDLSDYLGEETEHSHRKAQNTKISKYGM